MVEPLLYAALGFLTASLVALFMGRALWNRAVRLTTHRIMRRLPLSRDEIVASRDLLRAEVAIEHRKLERQANLMRERMTRSMADVGRRDATIVSMRGTVEEARVKAADADERVRGAKKVLDQMKLEMSALQSRLAKAEGGLAANERTHKKQVDERSDLLNAVERQRAETIAAVNEVAQVRLTVHALEEQLNAVKQELAATQGELEIARTEKNGAERGTVTDSEDIALLRTQIERLAGEITRVASGPAARSAAAGGALQSAVRATRDADTVTTASVTYPPVR